MDNDDLLGPPSYPPKKSGRGAAWKNADHPLRMLLIRACPPHPSTGRATLSYMATLLEVAEETIYSWVRNNSVPAKRVPKIVDLSEGRVSLGDFSPFIYF